MAEGFTCDDTVLCEDDKRRLMNCAELLEHDLDPDGILASMWSKNALSYRQKEDIDQEGSRWRKVRMLVNFITSGSQHTYDVFLGALNDDNQSHIAEKLKESLVISSTNMQPRKKPSPAPVADSRDVRGIRSEQPTNMNQDVQPGENTYQKSLKQFQQKESRHSNRQIQKEFGLDVGKAVFFIALLLVPRNVLVHGHEDIRQGWEPSHTLYVDMPSLFDPDKRGYYPLRILILGAAGSGKSTLIQHSCEQWALGNLWTQFSYVFTITCRRLNQMVEKYTEISMLDLLLKHGPKVAEADREIVRQEMLSNQKDVLILVDGVDELSGWLEFSPGEVLPATDLLEPATVLEHIHSLMAGRLMRESRVLFTSRPIDRIDPCLFEKTVRIFGFGRESIANCILALAKGNVAEQKAVLEYLDRRPQLYLFCTLPLGCIMTGRVVLDELSHTSKDQQQHEIINCSTVLYIYVLLVFLNRRGQSSTRIKDKFEGVCVWRQTLLKLTPLAAWGLLQRSPQIIFNSQTLRKHNIDENDLPCGLLDITYDENSSTQEPTYNSTTAAFIHYSIQEFLAALHIAITWKTGDINMITSRKASNQFSTVLLYLSGILGNPMGHMLIQAIDNKITSESLNKQLTKLFDILIVEYEGRFRLLPIFTKKRKDNIKLGRLLLLRCAAEGNHKDLVRHIDGLVMKDGVLDLTDMPGGLRPEHLPAVVFCLQWSRAIQSLRLEANYCCDLIKMKTAENEDRLVSMLDTALLRAGQLDLQGSQLSNDEIQGLVAYALVTSSLQTADTFSAVQLMRGITHENQARLVPLLDSLVLQSGRLDLNGLHMLEGDLEGSVMYVLSTESIETIEKYTAVKMMRGITLENQLQIVPILDSAVLSSGRLDLEGLPITVDDIAGLGIYIESTRKQRKIEQLSIIMLIKKLTPKIQSELVPLLDRCVLTTWRDMDDEGGECDGRLDLSLNSLTDKDVRAVGLYVSLSRQITYLNLWKCGITDQAMEILSSALEDHESLDTLNLWSNNLTDEGAGRLGKVLRGNTSLKTLKLTNNKVGDVGADSLFTALACNTSLKSLALAYNCITDLGISSLGTALTVNKTLKQLGLKFNKITDVAAVILSASLRDNSSLESLRLNGNEITDVGAESLFAALRVNSSLKSLKDLEHPRKWDFVWRQWGAAYIDTLTFGCFVYITCFLLAYWYCSNHSSSLRLALLLINLQIVEKNPFS